MFSCAKLAVLAAALVAVAASPVQHRRGAFDIRAAEPEPEPLLVKLEDIHVASKRQVDPFSDELPTSSVNGVISIFKGAAEQQRKRQVEAELPVKSVNGVIVPFFAKRQTEVEDAVKSVNGVVVPFNSKRQIDDDDDTVTSVINGVIVPFKAKRQTEVEDAVKSVNGVVVPFNSKRQIEVEDAVKSVNGVIVPFNSKRQVAAEDAVKSVNGVIVPFNSKRDVDIEPRAAEPEPLLVKVEDIHVAAKRQIDPFSDEVPTSSVNGVLTIFKGASQQ